MLLTKRMLLVAATVYTAADLCFDRVSVLLLSKYTVLFATKILPFVELVVRSIPVTEEFAVFLVIGAYNSEMVLLYNCNTKPEVVIKPLTVEFIPFAYILLILLLNMYSVSNVLALIPVIKPLPGRTVAA